MISTDTPLHSTLKSLTLENAMTFHTFSAETRHKLIFFLNQQLVKYGAATYEYGLITKRRGSHSDRSTGTSNTSSEPLRLSKLYHEEILDTRGQNNNRI